MSKADSEVKFCLEKAKKGLKKVEPDFEEAKKHIAKAEHNFKAVLFFEKSLFSDWAASAVFYTIYHCFLAITAKFGYESRNQMCTIALVEQLKESGEIEISNELIETLRSTDHEEVHQRSTIELRENYQYGTETSMKSDILEEKKELCKKALEEAKSILYGHA